MGWSKYTYNSIIYGIMRTFEAENYKICITYKNRTYMHKNIEIENIQLKILSKEVKFLELLKHEVWNL